MPPTIYPVTELRPRKREAGLGAYLDLLLSLYESEQRAVIVEGPPGTGKTLLAEEFARQIAYRRAIFRFEQCRLTTLFSDYLTRVHSSEGIQNALARLGPSPFVWELVVLHGAYQYEDLVRGYRLQQAQRGSVAESSAGANSPQSTNFQVLEGTVGFMCRVTELIGRSATEDQMPRGLLIMDEINRAPIGRVFGELLYAMDRRGRNVATPYPLETEAGEIFPTLRFPRELFLVGTMNSTDRSAAGFDYALRRRFEFVELRPDRSIVDHYWATSPIQNQVLSLFDAVANLIAQAHSMEVVAKSDLEIGHGYFLPKPEWFATNRSNEDKLKTWLANALSLRVYPLLRDYQEQGLLKFPDDPGAYRALPKLTPVALSGEEEMPTPVGIRAQL